MPRNLLLAAVASTVLAGSVEAVAVRIPAPAGIVGARNCGIMAPPRSVAERFARAEVVVAGKVAAIDKEAVQAAPYPGAPNKVAHKVATVKVETGLAGADKMTEIKVGFVALDKLAPNDRRLVRWPPELKEGQELILFLAKHPSADFYVMGVNPPVDLKDGQGKKDLETVKKMAAALADPMKGLKSDKPEVRAETAVFLVTKYRLGVELGLETEQVAIPADESKLILKALAEGDWSTKVAREPGSGPTALNAFSALALGKTDGWITPDVRNKPDTPPVDYGDAHKAAFARWLDGPGKDYVIKRVVPKKQ